jgi:hypothetical protein
MMKIAARVTSNEDYGCPFCGEISLDGIDHFVRSARHLQESHGLVCLHVGQETAIDHEGRQYQRTVAIFGTP